MNLGPGSRPLRGLVRGDGGVDTIVLPVAI